DEALPQIAGSAQPEFTTEDYLTYVDGRPREEGVRSLLASRSLSAKEGGHDDGPEVLSIHGLAARKQGFFEAVLNRDGVAVFDTTVELIHRLAADGIPTALVTSSRNGREVLRRAGLTEAFDVVVD